MGIGHLIPSLSTSPRCNPKACRTQLPICNVRCARRLLLRLLAYPAGIGNLLLLCTILEASAQSQYFEVLRYRSPSQCERMQCLNIRDEHCREHLHGFYLKEKGCPDGQMCTNCEYGNSTVPTKCRCENPPFAIPMTYNQECNSGKVCAAGEGMCYRPCNTYLHPTVCPDSHCQWSTSGAICEPKPPAVQPLMWMTLDSQATIAQQGKMILQNTPNQTFPISFADFRHSAKGYRIQGLLLSNITKMETIFLQLDVNNDGQLDIVEYAQLPSVLIALDDAVQNQALVLNTTARRMQESASPTICGARGLYFCSFDNACKQNCRECGWKSAAAAAYSECVLPSAKTCYADGGKTYCPTDEECKPPGDCTTCIDRPVADYSQHMCLALWWDPQPLTQWQNWVCRFRNKVGMPCRNDQDCVHGLRRCMLGKCQPLQPYNSSHLCQSDLDCPHMGFYCPEDPTGGENPYWITFCREQRGEGMTCAKDRECGPDMRCNIAEGQPRCRRLFSLDLGSPGAVDELCMSGWRDRDMLCAPAAQSNEMGRSCDSDRDCTTTDQSGRTGECVCKAWWDKDNSKYCKPITGDYENYQEKLRNYLWFQSQNCGSFWTEDDCLRIFGNKALKLKLEVDCETQRLSGGPYLPPASCAIPSDDRFFDSCRQMNALG